MNKYELRTTVICLFSSTTVEKPLQISSFMQNKANFRKAQMNVTKVLTRDYENKTLGERGKNKANSKPNKANLLNAQMNVNKVLTKEYEKMSNWALYENEPKTNPIKPNFTSAQRRRTAVQRIKNPLQLPSQISRLSKRPCYKSLKKVKKIKCPTLKQF